VEALAVWANEHTVIARIAWCYELMSANVERNKVRVSKIERLVQD
jgi:hypothetical protein